MRVRGHGRRVTLGTATATAAVVAAALLGVAAHADPGGSGGVTIPGQGDIDRAKATVRDRQVAADHLQPSLAPADRRLPHPEGSAALAAQASAPALAPAPAATRA